VYYITIQEDCNLQPYHFIINGASVHDPYAKMHDLNWETSGYASNDIVIAAYAVPPKDYNAPPLNHKTDALVYEMHVRDYTIGANSGVDSNLKGTFAGLTQTGTTYEANGQTYSTGIDHLKELGITHV
jgi:pullulanase